MLLLSGWAAAQTTSSVSYTVVNNYPVSLTPNTAVTVTPTSTQGNGVPWTVSITPGTGGTWLTATPNQGVTPNSFSLALTASAATLAPGQYTSTAVVNVGFSIFTQNTINVTLVVDTEAALAVTGNPALSGGGFNLGTYYQDFTTPGTQVLNVTTVSPSSGAPATAAGFTVTQSVFNSNTPSTLLSIAGIQPFTTTGTSSPVPVTISFNPQVANSMAPGTYGGTLAVAVTQSGVSTSPQSVAVPWSLTIVAEPVIQAPPSLTLNVPAAGSASTTFAITAVQNIPISLSASSTAPWLSVTPTSTTANGGTITVTGNSAGLQAGAYQGTITVTSASASNSPVTIPVTMNVLAPTITNLSPSSIAAGSAAFTLTVSGSNYDANSVIVFGGTSLGTHLVNSGSLTGTVNASQVTTAGPVSVTVANTSGSVSVSSGPATFTVSPSVNTNTPLITPPLQSSPPTSTTPTLGNAITSGTNLATFRLYINGKLQHGRPAHRDLDQHQHQCVHHLHQPGERRAHPDYRQYPQLTLQRRAEYKRHGQRTDQ